jgi:tetratricopeptide (TPR) repeat protein
VQGKWQEAAQEYRAALQNNPQAPGIHYLLGRLLLSRPKTPATMEDARKEFEEELKINPAKCRSGIRSRRAGASGRKMAGSHGPLHAVHSTRRRMCQLAIAYRRVGRKADADCEALAHQQTSANGGETKDQIQKGVSGQVRWPALKTLRCGNVTCSVMRVIKRNPSTSVRIIQSTYH